MGIEEVVKAIIREEGFEMGKTEGKKERDLELIHNLIFKFGYSNEKAASLLKVSVKFVEDVRAEQLFIS